MASKYTAVGVLVTYKYNDRCFGHAFYTSYHIYIIKQDLKNRDGMPKSILYISLEEL